MILEAVTLNRWDKLLTITIIVLALLALVVFEVFAFGKSGDTVVIYIDGQAQASYNFRALSTPKEYVCQTEHGYNKIIIDSRGAYVSESSCADQTEVKQGRIHKANTSLVCLPNRLVVQIEGGRSDADIVSY